MPRCLFCDSEVKAHGYPIIKVSIKVAGNERGQHAWNLCRKGDCEVAAAIAANEVTETIKDLFETAAKKHRHKREVERGNK